MSSFLKLSLVDISLVDFFNFRRIRFHYDKDKVLVVDRVECAVLTRR